MFAHLNWQSVERAASKLENKKTQPLMLIIRNADKTVLKRKISSDQFRKQLWELYDNKKLLLEIAVVAKDNSVIYHYASNISDAFEKKPTTGEPWLVEDWKTFPESRKEVLLKMLMTQILDSNDK